MDETLNNTQQPAQGAQTQYEIASIFERTIAFIFDFFLIFSVFALALFLLVRADIWMPSDLQITLYMGCSWIIFLLYSAVFNSQGRRTAGKFLMSIQVVDKNTLQPLSFGKSFVRSLGYLIGIVTFFAGFALALFYTRRFAVQDLMASSVVISTREKTAAEAVVISVFGTLLIGLCVFYVYYVLFVMPSAYDKKRVEDADAQLGRIAFLQLQHKELFGAYTPDMVRLGLISGDPVRFQRDIQRNLRRRGFSVGIDKNGFSIKAVAKDSEDTEVSISMSN
ncbi:MAG: RDD family protein [Elusimicrobiota bacterium]|jgi:uncharacterized RDD family membrane protein YckC|nr:RDD family protein [Elusimicrobiota bacterium]